MRYILMCGGVYPKWETPRQLLKINGEVLIERTIRLLRENGVKDIAISTNDKRFDYLDVEKLRDKNNEYVNAGENENKLSKNSWLRAYYPVNEPVCYLHGDVYFSDEAIKTIVNYEVEDTMFFVTGDDGKNKSPYNLKGREPLAYKVVNYKRFRSAVDDLLRMIDEGRFKNAKCKPIAWTVYRYLNYMDIGFEAQGYGDLNSIYNKKGDYAVINDITTDIDTIKDIPKIENFLRIGGGSMIKVEVIKEFTLRDFDKLEDIKRKSREVEGKLFVGDTFNCTEKMMKYLTGGNAYKDVFVKVIEVIPEAKVEEKKEEVEFTNVIGKVEFLEEATPSLKVTRKSTKKKRK